MSAAAQEAPADLGSWGAIWRLSWPIVLTMVASALVGLLDTWIAGGMGPVAQAAVGLTMQMVLLINATITAVSIGAQALVARFVGARNWEQAARAAQQALVLALVLSLVVLPIFWFAAPWLFAFMGAPPEVQATGTWYLRTLLLGLLPMDLGIVLSAIFRGRGRTKAMMTTQLAEAGIWIAGSLVLGHWLGWGLPGLAVGFVAGKVVSFVLGVLLIRRMKIWGSMTGAWWPERAWFTRILRIGLPAGVQVLVRNGGMMAYFGILGLLAKPTEAVAAFTIGFRIESLAFLPVFALNIAAATLVGQNLGAGRPDEAERAVWRIVAVAVTVLSTFALIFWFGADALAGLFTSDPIVRGYTADYLRVMAVSEPFLALVMVQNGGLQGAGDAKAPMIAVIIFQIGVRLPMAYFLAIGLGWGVSGAWWALTASLITQSAAITWYFRRGTWRTREI